MPQNLTPWEWTDARLLAAQRVADGRQTDEEIAAEAGVHRKTLHLWKHRPEFAARVAELTAALEAAVLKTGIAARVRRVEAMDRRWRGMQRVIDERAADPGMRGVPGGSTGLLAHDVKIIGAGETAEKVDVYEVDTGLLREMREVEKQAAQDLGQWTEKSEHTGTGPGGAIVVVNLGPGQSLDDL